MIPSNEVANINSQKLFPAETRNNNISHKDHSRKTKKFSEDAISHQPLLVKLSRGSCEGAGSVKSISSNCHGEKESNHLSPNYKAQRGQIISEENERVNNDHLYEGNGQIHDEDEKDTSGDEADELLLDEYEGDGDIPSEELAQAKEEQVLVNVTKEQDTKPMEEDSEAEDEDEDDGHEEEKHPQKRDVRCEENAVRAT